MVCGGQEGGREVLEGGGLREEEEERAREVKEVKEKDDVKGGMKDLGGCEPRVALGGRAEEQFAEVLLEQPLPRLVLVVHLAVFNKERKKTQQHAWMCVSVYLKHHFLSFVCKEHED